MADMWKATVQQIMQSLTMTTIITDINSSFNPDKSSIFNDASNTMNNESYIAVFAKDSGANCMSPLKSECMT
eukprot:15348212-Ditylum_brightwellii.AAC.1